MTSLKELKRAIRKQEIIVNNLREDMKDVDRTTLTTGEEWVLANTILNALNSAVEKVTKSQEKIEWLKS